MQRLGIDIGSKTLKLVLLDEDGSEIFSSYEKHKSRIAECLRESVHAISWRLGDRQVCITVTGSSGMRVSELFGIPFVQEVVALKRSVLATYPDADAVLEMGGEDTKLVYLTGAPEQRMNNICAGGTGSFIEMMGGLMGTRTANMNRLAMGYKTIYPIASRCAVFAKSDVRPLVNAGARLEDIAASVLDAVCTQAIAGLSAGRPLTGKVLLLGGPFQHITALRDAFCRVSGFDRDHAIVPKEAHLFVARGAALSHRFSKPMMLSEFESLLRTSNFESAEGIERLRPLFDTDDERAAFRARHNRTRVPRVSMLDAGTDLFIGVDAGSTTAKLALINKDGALVAYDYHRHRGDVIGSLSKMLKKLHPHLRPAYTDPPIIRRSCVVGYGEQLCRTAFGIDDGEVETVAHLRAAMAIDPQVDFLLDIGGQDVKCFYIRDGVIQDVVLNEACSSGCGSLFDSVSKTMGRSRADFVEDAMRATAPVDLGTRCTTFMNSRIRHAQKEGASKEDIAAGVCYATARNALFKVVRQPDFTKVGEHIVVQGGAFGNDALLRAFELETGVEVSRPDLAPIMGAWGAALLARDAWLAQLESDPEAALGAESGFIDISTLDGLDVSRRVERCEGCSNACELRITQFANLEGGIRRAFGNSFVEGSERIMVTGNRCERGALLHGASAEKLASPPNLVRFKRALIASYDNRDDGSSRRAGGEDELVRIGIPRGLALYESYPFWRTLFDELGIFVVAGADPDDGIFKKGMACIPAEGMCYPAKLVYGQAADLVERGATVLFVPALDSAFARYGLTGKGFSKGLSTCPLVQEMGAMIAGNAEGSILEGVAVATPDLTGAACLNDIIEPIARSLAQVGIDCDPVLLERAVKVASEEYRTFRDRIETRAQEVLAKIDQGVYPGIALIQHAYHAAEGISHGVDGLLGELGYAVLEEVDFGGTPCAAPADEPEGGNAASARWYESAEAIKRIEDCAQHPNLQPIIIRSFGCGIDALIADDLRDRMHDADHIYTELKLDQIVDLATVRIRLRSLAYAHRQREGAMEVFDLTVAPQTHDATEIDVENTPEGKRKPQTEAKGGQPQKIQASPAKARPITWRLMGIQPPTEVEQEGSEFTHEYQGLAVVVGADVPSDIAPPGSPA